MICLQRSANAAFRAAEAAASTGVPAGRPRCISLFLRPETRSARLRFCSAPQRGGASLATSGGRRRGEHKIAARAAGCRAFFRA